MAGIAALRTRNGRSLALVVMAGSLITSIGLGARSTFGLYLDPVIADLGTGRGMFSLAIAIQNIVWGLSQPFAGAIADRYGAARVLSVGAVGYALALVMMSTAESPGIFTLSAGFLIGLATGAASFSVVLAAVGRMAPPDRAAMALGVVTAMGSVGQFVLIPITRQFIDAYGWRTTATILAALVATMALFSRPVRGTALAQQGDREVGALAPPAVPLAQELRRALHHRPYLLLNAAFFVCGFHVTFISTHLVSYSRDVGISGGPASTGLALIGLFNIVGSLAAGYFGSRKPKTYLLSGIYAARAAVITTFVLVPISSTSVIVFGAAMGLLWLSTVPLTGGIVAAQFGTTHSGTLFGIVFLSHQIGAFIGVFMAGVLADRTGSYLVVWWIAIALGVFASLLHLVINDRPAPPAPERLAPAGRIVPAGAATVLVAVGAAAALATPPAEPAGADEVRPPFCVLHPTG
ncbi:MAG: MFS transporter [Acidimicrobiia bacterium]|nr:MFS transporter [Acidimicrobiia bacterium]